MSSPLDLRVTLNALAGSSSLDAAGHGETLALYGVGGAVGETAGMRGAAAA